MRYLTVRLMNPLGCPFDVSIAVPFALKIELVQCNVHPKSPNILYKLRFYILRLSEAYDY